MEAETAGSRALKGLPSTVEVVRIPWAENAGDDVALLLVLARHASVPFVGRRERDRRRDGLYGVDFTRDAGPAEATAG